MKPTPVRSLCPHLWMLLLILFSALLVPARATDYYLTVAGSGAKTGASWTDAYAASSLWTVVNTTLQPGDTLYLGGQETAGAAHYGDQRLTISASGTAAAKKSLVGVDRGFGLPKFVGIQTTRSYTTITLADTVSHWTIQNLYIEHRDYGVATAGTGHAGITIDGITARDIRSAGFSFTDSDGLLVQNCKAERYSGVGFKFNHSCDGVTVKNCVANCTGIGTADDPAWRLLCSSPVGFDFHIKNSTAAFNTNLLLEDCLSLHNNEDTADTGDYEQGDGFKMERSNDGVTLRRCASNENQDAAFDLKGSNQVLEDCVATGNYRYGFKVWYEGTLTNCASVDNGARQFTLAATSSGYTVTANHCTFHSDTGQSGAVIETAGNTLTLNDSILSFAGAAGTYTGGGGTFTLNGTVKLANTANTANSPQYINPVLPWDGSGTNFDNQTYGVDKGYASGGIVQEGLHEAEDMTRTDSGVGTTVITEAGGSGTGWVKLNATATGDWVQFTAPAVPAGTYTVVVMDKTYSDRGSYQLSVGGTNVGSVVDQYAATSAFRDQIVGDVTFASAGDRTFRFTVTGKNGASSGYVLSVDAVLLVPVTSPGTGTVVATEADTYVWDGATTTNYGTATTLSVKNGTSGSDRISYLRFPVSASGGTILAATLKIKVTSIGAEGAGARTVEIRQLTDDTWSETGVTWNSQPSSAGTLIATIDAGTVGEVHSIDVTPYITQEAAADGKASFVLVQPSGVNKFVNFGSRENAGNEPALEIVREPVTITAEADTYVWDGATTTNYGTAATLSVKNGSAGSDRISYLRFPVSGVGTFTSATLKIKVTSIGAEGAGARTVEIRQLTDDTWSETGVTWNSQPSSAGTLIATIDAGTVGEEHSIDVTAYITQEVADGKASFVLVQPSGVNRFVNFGSRENADNAPSLEIQ